MKENNEIQGKTKIDISVATYIKKNNTNNASLYVPNIENCKQTDVEYIILVESPHIEEIESKIPLSGKTGKMVAKFLFGKDDISIGKLVKECNPSKTNDKKKAIINVCNIPLQVIDSKNEKLVNKDELLPFRSNCQIDTVLEEKLLIAINNYENARMIIVCGRFARTYFEKIQDRLKKSRIESLYVPHPSYNHWSFIYQYTDDISTLKRIFSREKKNG